MPALVASIHAFVLYAALPDVIFCAGLPGTFESSMLSPSAIVGWARTALASLL
jgi:hypothetical protein